MIKLNDLMSENRSQISDRKGCLMAMVDNVISEKIFNFGKKIIKEEILYTEDKEFGRENSPLHCTIRYGFTRDLNELEVRQLIKGHKPFTMEIVGMDKFDTNPDYDVVKFRVESQALRELHEASSIYPNESNFPNYDAHMTLAYVKKNSFPHLKEGMKMKIPVRTLCYSPISGDKSYYDLDENKIA